MRKITKIQHITALATVLLAFWWITSDLWLPFHMLVCMASGYLVGWYATDIWYMPESN